MSATEHSGVASRAWDHAGLVWLAYQHIDNLWAGAIRYEFAALCMVAGFSDGPGATAAWDEAWAAYERGDPVELPRVPASEAQKETPT